VNGNLFFEYINNIFVPYLTDPRETEQFEACEACEAVLLIDNCSIHMSDDITADLTRERVRIVTFASDTAQIFQMLDMVLFGALKKHHTGLGTLDEEQPAATFLLRVYRNFKQMIVEVNIWGAFAIIGFTHDMDQILYEVLFDKEKFQQSPGFVELWGRNVPLESLSKRWREAKFE
jgi:hypothetical protein